MFRRICSQSRRSPGKNRTCLDLERCCQGRMRIVLVGSIPRIHNEVVSSIDSDTTGEAHAATLSTRPRSCKTICPVHPASVSVLATSTHAVVAPVRKTFKVRLARLAICLSCTADQKSAVGVVEARATVRTVGVLVASTTSAAQWVRYAFVFQAIVYVAVVLAGLRNRNSDKVT